jgi:hypothetical protein
MLQDLREDGEAGAREMLGHHLHLHRVAQVGLVGPVPERGVAVGDARPDLIDGAPAAELVEDALQHRFDRLEHVLLLDEAHLHVELVEIRGRAVGARVLVAETGRDLEIPVEARHHQELLELLRRLRQRVELAGMEARGHEEVARALGAGGRDDRRLVFAEPAVPHPPPDRGHDVGAQRHVRLHAASRRRSR